MFAFTLGWSGALKPLAPHYCVFQQVAMATASALPLRRCDITSGAFCSPCLCVTCCCPGPAMPWDALTQLKSFTDTLTDESRNLYTSILLIMFTWYMMNTWSSVISVEVPESLLSAVSLVKRDVPLHLTFIQLYMIADIVMVLIRIFIIREEQVKCHVHYTDISFHSIYLETAK